MRYRSFGAVSRVVLANRIGVTALVFTLAFGLQACRGPAPKPAGPSVQNGALPPGDAMSLSVSEARIEMIDAIKKTYTGTVTECSLGFCGSGTGTAPRHIHVGMSGFSFDTSDTINNSPQQYGKSSATFRKDVEGYIGPFPVAHVKVPARLFNVGYLPNPTSAPASLMFLNWSDGKVAQQFANAFNRLLYAAWNGGSYTSQKEWNAFGIAAARWRANPNKPPLPDAADRQRILAEYAIQQKDVEAAAEHYESALQIDPMWPQGWFNLALIYAEQKDYGLASDRMKHYLVMLPNAPDAKASRAQMIIWDDKAKNGGKL